MRAPAPFLQFVPAARPAAVPALASVAFQGTPAGAAGAAVMDIHQAPLVVVAVWAVGAHQWQPSPAHRVQVTGVTGVTDVTGLSA